MANVKQANVTREKRITARSIQLLTSDWVSLYIIYSRWPRKGNKMIVGDFCGSDIT